MRQHQFVFIGGLHRTATNFLAHSLGNHPLISEFRDTRAPGDEGQFLQSIYPSEEAYGGPSQFGFHPEAHLTEASPLAGEENRRRLIAEWGVNWDMRRPVLLERSSINLIGTRFLQALFPEAYFLIVVRHPIAVALASGNWSIRRTPSLLGHWLVCHELFEEDRAFVQRLRVLTYEELIDKPQATLDGVYSFLGLPSHPQEFRTDRENRRQARYMAAWSTLTKGPDSADRSELLNAIEKYGSRAKRFGYTLTLPDPIAPAKSPQSISSVTSPSETSSRGPDFLILGAQKAGTTSLYSYLTLHPNVAPPERKELHFFDGVLAYECGVDSYRTLFPARTTDAAGLVQITGEATPDYLFDPRVPGRVAEHFPHVKLLVVLRNPADRAYSHYQMLIRRRTTQETLSFEEAIDSESRRLEGERERIESDPHYHSRLYRRFSYLTRGIYVDQLMRWAKFFSRDQMLILESNELRSRHAAALARVYDFLGLADCDVPTRQSKNSGSYEPMNPRTRARLIEYFAPHNRRLYDYLGVDFGWK